MRPGGRSGLRCETARAAPRSRIERRRQELQRHRLTEPQIVGAIDFAHAAAAEQADDPIAAVENDAGRELSVIDRARRRQPAA